MAEEIERLKVVIEGDLAELLQDVEQGTKKAEDRLKKFERTGKQAFKVIKTAAQAATATIIALGASIAVLVNAAEQGLAGVRIRRAFKNLAASVGQSGGAILSAMTEASDGTVTAIDLMTQANTALQLGVARTPAEFEQLTRAAITLGRAVGAGPTESINLLINAAGRRSTEVLDNLGISLAEVNGEMDRLARQEFGKSSKQLSTVQANALFMQATLTVAANKADTLSKSLDDVGSNMEQATIRVKEFQSDFNEASLVVVGKTAEIGEAMGQAFFGPNGVFPLFEEGGNLVAEVFARILAGFLAVAGAIAQSVTDVRKVFEGELDIGEVFGADGAKRAADRIADNYSKALDKIKTDFSEVFSPQDLEAPGGVDVVPVVDPVVVEEAGDKTKEILASLSDEFLNLQAETNAELEANESEHLERMKTISDKFFNAAKEAREDASKDILDLEQDIRKSRDAIFASSREDLARLEQQTDKELEKVRTTSNTKEARATEDHLRSMRQLRLNFLDNLEDAVTSRDARRVRDLQRQFAREGQKQEQNFQTARSREGEDNNARLAEIRQGEQQRSQEIIAEQNRRLEALRIHEAERRTEIGEGLQVELEEIRLKGEAAALQEQQEHQTRQDELNNALANRLQSLALELAAEDEITQEGARTILSTYNDFFGIGGEIDELMAAFSKRQRERMKLSLQIPKIRGSGSSGPSVQRQPIGQVQAFAEGGSMIARKPTLALFGEKTPEMAQFTPLNKMGGGRPQQMQIEFSGSAPPGIRGGEIEQIAAIINRAFREAGA